MEPSPSPSSEEIAAAPEIAMTVADIDIDVDNPEESNNPTASSTSALASVTEIAPADGEGVVGGAPPPSTIISDDSPLPSSNANTNICVEPSSSSSSSVTENIITTSPALSIATTAATATNPTTPATAGKPPTTNKKASTTAKSRKNKGTEEKTRKKPKTKKIKLGADGSTVTDVVGKNKSSQQQQQQQLGEIMTKKKTKEKSPKGGDKSAMNANRKTPKLTLAASKKRKDKTSSLVSGGVQGETDGTGGSCSGVEQNSKQRSNNSNTATTTTTTYSAQQAAVNDMMRRAFEEDQYSALGSIVDTDSSDDDDNNYHYQERNNNSTVNGGGEDDDNNNEGGSSSFRFNHRPKRGSSSSSSNGLDATSLSFSGEMQAASWMEGNNVNNRKIDRNTLMIAMRRHLRIEGTKTVRNFDKETFLEDAANYLDDVAGNCSRGGPRKRSMGRGVSIVPRLSSGMENDSFGAVGDHGMIPEEDLATDGRRIGKRRKKRKRGKPSSLSTQQPEYASGGAVDSLRMSGTCNGADVSMSGSGNDDDDDDDDVWESNNNIYSAPMDTTSNTGAGASYYDQDDDLIGNEEEISIFGQTTGSSNATWVECDRCKKWRRLRGVVDARKLPARWFCSMNKNDPNRARCSAPEEEYDSSSAPESAVDQRTRKHLRVWVRRLHCNEAYENRQRSSKKRAAAALLSMTAKEPYEWIRCCNPACGKWRMLLRSMDASSVIDKCDGGEWYCVMNTWDEKTASCGAAQENLPSVGCPPWVLVDTED